MTYLEEHRLVTSKAPVLLSASRIQLSKITAQGIDFLADDGGLPALLNVVTVRLDGGSLKALLSQKVEAAALPAEEKFRLKTLLQKAGEEGSRGPRQY